MFGNLSFVHFSLHEETLSIDPVNGRLKSNPKSTYYQLMATVSCTRRAFNHHPAQDSQIYSRNMVSEPPGLSPTSSTLTPFRPLDDSKLPINRLGQSHSENTGSEDMELDCASENSPKPFDPLLSGGEC